MTQAGTLRDWNDARGFGFITPASGGADVFVHISAFARHARPVVGDALLYEPGSGPDGRPRAVRVHVTRARARQATPRAAPRSSRTRPVRRYGFVGWLAVLGIAAYATSRFWPGSAIDRDALRDAPSREPGRESVLQIEPVRSFECDGRTHCSQMSSCAEATFFVRHCPGTQMDGDGDGVPCESQWCG